MLVVVAVALPSTEPVVLVVSVEVEQARPTKATLSREPQTPVLVAVAAVCIPTTASWPAATAVQV